MLIIYLKIHTILWKIVSTTSLTLYPLKICYPKSKLFAFHWPCIIHRNWTLKAAVNCANRSTHILHSEDKQTFISFVVSITSQLKILFTTLKLWFTVLYLNCTFNSANNSAEDPIKNILRKETVISSIYLLTWTLSESKLKSWWFGL